MNLKVTIILFLCFILIPNGVKAGKKKTSAILKIKGIVEKCHDGDTCRIQSSGRLLKVRFSGIDTPELKQKYGQQARKFTEEIVKGKWVDLECEGKSYDRLTCLVFIEGMNVNAEIVKNGWGYDSPKYSRGRFRAIQEQAKIKKIGVWVSSEKLDSPYCFRRPSAKPCLKNKAFMP
jgi:endonuclease YncB( thermonuclease family)